MLSAFDGESIFLVSLTKYGKMGLGVQEIPNAQNGCTEFSHTSTVFGLALIFS